MVSKRRWVLTGWGGRSTSWRRSAGAAMTGILVCGLAYACAQARIRLLAFPFAPDHPVWLSDARSVDPDMQPFAKSLERNDATLESPPDSPFGPQICDDFCPLRPPHAGGALTAVMGATQSSIAAEKAATGHVEPCPLASARAGRDQPMPAGGTRAPQPDCEPSIDSDETQPRKPGTPGPQSTSPRNPE
jgi:hypothetical protein